MIYKVFTVFDSKIDVFLPPFFCRTSGEAARIMMDMCSDKNHNFYKYRSEFMLFELGTYDDSTGMMVPLTAPTPLSLLSEYCNVDDVKS